MLTEYMPKSAAKMADSLMQRYGLLDKRWSYYISEAVGSWNIKGTGAYIQAACEMERSDHAGSAA